MPCLPCASLKLGAERYGFQPACGSRRNNPHCPRCLGSLRLSNAYRGVVMTRVVLRLALLALLFTPRAATAQDPRQSAPRQFDFYVLSLSWSPSFCAGAAERGARNANVQCGPRPFSFVVHGLWPQYDNGFPEYCQIPAPRLDRGVVSSMLDLMPAPRLIFNEWDRHGTCSGQLPRAYFENGENPARIYRSQGAAQRDPAGGRRGFHQGQSRIIGERDGGRLRCQAFD